MSEIISDSMVSPNTMVLHEDHMIGTRADIRSTDAFVKNLKYWTERELEIFRIWIDNFNDRSKKIRYVWYPWGGGCAEIFEDNNIKLNLVNRPDVLLCRLKDNQREIAWISPIEVQQTSAPISRLKYIYLKKEKVERQYDNITPHITSRGQCILFVSGSGLDEQCLLIKSRQIESLKNNTNPSPCSVFGGKLAYNLPITEGMRLEITYLRGELYKLPGQTYLTGVARA